MSKINGRWCSMHEQRAPWWANNRGDSDSEKVAFYLNDIVTRKTAWKKIQNKQQQKTKLIIKMFRAQFVKNPVTQGWHFNCNCPDCLHCVHARAQRCQGERANANAVLLVKWCQNDGDIMTVQVDYFYVGLFLFIHSHNLFCLNKSAHWCS